MTQKLVDLPQRIAACLEPFPEVVGGYLFGSRVSDEARDDSDVDVGLLLDSKAPVRRLVEIEDSLEQALGLAVDVVDLGSCDPFLALDAIRGERVFERDGLRLDEFDLYVLRRAGDLAPLERERRRQLLETGLS